MMNSYDRLKEILDYKRFPILKDRCIAVGFEKSWAYHGKCLFAISGFEDTFNLDRSIYKVISDEKSIVFEKQNFINFHNQLIKQIKEMLSDIFQFTKCSEWQMKHLTRSVETTFYDYENEQGIIRIDAINIYDYLNTFSIKHDNKYIVKTNIKRLFSCCERKILSNINRKNKYDIVVSKKPCDICDRYICVYNNFHNVIYK